MSSRKSLVKEKPFVNPVEEKTIEKPRKAKAVEQGLALGGEEEEINLDAEQGESNVVQDTTDKESATGQTETKEDEPSLQEQMHDALPLSGFDFKHLMVLQRIPISSFYGVDFDNLNLPLQPSSYVGSFYGLDTESLAAENAALDEFYAKRKSKKASCGSQDQSQNILFPESASEDDDDIKILHFLWEYTLYYGPIPDVLGQPTTRIGPHHPLLVYVNCKFQQVGFITGSWLTEKILKLQTKYKKLVAEKGKTPEHQEFPTPAHNSFFQLSRMIWERDEEFDILREVDVQCKDNVQVEAVEIRKLVIDDEE